jgi:N-acetylglucosamine-6-phosphate deacetylase
MIIDMKSFSFNVEQLLLDDTIVHHRSLTIQQNKIHCISELKPNLPLLKGLLIPGYIDLQVNGGGGQLFNDDPSLKTLKTIATAHQAFGTTGWLPTLVTDSFKNMQLAVHAVSEGIQHKKLGILGIHFEGPFLSTQKKGIHSESFIRKISQKEMDLFTRKDIGQVIVTLAPEKVPIERIRELTDKGVIVCLGHSNATLEQTNLALDAGAKGFTHLFNAMSGFTSRNPGMLGAAMLDINSFAGIILDGIHVHPESARLAYQLKKKMFLVTDAMPPVGSEEKYFHFFGERIQKKGLTLTNESGRLAGSALDMNTAVINAEKMLAIGQIEAIQLATIQPSIFLGIDAQQGRLKEGFFANMILLNHKKEVIQSWIYGKNTQSFLD